MRQIKAKENAMIFIPLTVLSDEDKVYVESLHYSENEKLCFLMKRILKDEQLAQDAVQITFEKVMNKLALIKKFEDREKAKGYIYVMAKNTAYDLLRKNKYRQYQVMDELSVEFRDKDFDTEEIVIQKIEQEQLAEYVKKLKPKHKKAIDLRYKFHLKYSEIAKITLTTSANARYRVQSGIEAVRSMIAEGESKNNKE